MNKLDYKKVIDGLEDFPHCKKKFLEFSEYLAEDQRKIFSDSVKNWHSLPGGIIWGIFIYIWYSLIPQVRGFSLAYVEQISAWQNFYVFIVVLLSIAFIFSQIYLVTCLKSPYNIQEIIVDISRFLSNIKEYNLDDEIAVEKLEEIIIKQKLDILQCYENKIISMKMQKDSIFCFQFISVGTIALCSALIVSRMDMIPACYPKTMDELLKKGAVQKCYMEIDGWKLRKPPEQNPPK
ncbi:hypothetical protein [Asaia sp. HN010]|uniref:hypothetical protein n=1 Tax=Asaia sp. HN010 TaxID=3081233 RepID=UPI00301601B9